MNIFDRGPGSRGHAGLHSQQLSRCCRGHPEEGGQTGRSTRELQDGEIKRLLASVQLLRQRLKAAERDVTRIASENARLVSENAVLRAQLGARNVVNLRRRQDA
jgi:hypothetical protein